MSWTFCPHKVFENFFSSRSKKKCLSPPFEKYFRLRAKHNGEKNSNLWIIFSVINSGINVCPLSSVVLEKWDVALRSVDALRFCFGQERESPNLKRLMDRRLICFHLKSHKHTKRVSSLRKVRLLRKRFSFGKRASQWDCSLIASVVATSISNLMLEGTFPIDIKWN